MNDNEARIAIVADAAGVAPGVDQAKAAVQGLGASAAAASAQMRGSFATVSTSVREMGVTIRETVGMVGEMREAMVAFGEAMLAAFAVEKIADWAKEMGEGAEKVAHTAEIFGMTVPQVQGLQAAAAATGMSIDTLAKGMGILDRNMINAASGVGTAAVAFKAIGVSASDGKTQMETLLAIADKFKNMDDGPKKVALAMELFGRSGKEMIPFLDMGAAGIEKLDEKSQEYAAGVMIATTANQGLRDWLDQVNERGVALAESTNETKIAMQGVSNVMTDEFAPVLKIAVDGVNELIQAFIENYREGGVVKDMLDAVAGVMRLVGEAFEAAWDIIKTFGEVFTEIGQAVAGEAADTYGGKVPTHLHTMTEVVNMVREALIAFKDGAIAVTLSIGVAFEELRDLIAGACKVIYDALMLKWGAIESDWHNAMAAIASDAEKQAGRIKAAWTEAAAAVQGKVKLPGGDGTEGVKEPKGSGDFDPDLAKPKKAKKPKKEKADPADKDNSAATDLEEAKSDAAAKLAIAESNATTIEELAKLSAQEQLDAVEKAENAGVITKRQAIAQKVAILATEVQAEITAANTIYQAKVAALKAEEAAEIASMAAKQGALDKSDKDYLTKYTNLQNQIQAAQIKTNNQLAILAAQHENQLTTINAKGVADRDKAEVKSVSARAAMEKTAIDSISKSWSSALGQMATGQMTFSKGIQTMYMGMVDMIGSALSGMIEKWMQQQLTALIFGRTQQSVTGAAQVASNAAVAGAAAFASTAAIPIIGPELAPAAATAAYAGAMAFAPLASAFGGWGEVPYDGAMTQLHKSEMVLPANLATPLRSMLTSGGSNDNSGGASDSGDHYHYHDHTSTSSPAQIIANRGAMVTGLAMAKREGRMAAL